MIFCPWCEEWAPKDSFITLNMPPSHQNKLSKIFKHVDGGCGWLFAPTQAPEAKSKED